jgi:hypothetical protein
MLGAEEKRERDWYPREHKTLATEYHKVVRRASQEDVAGPCTCRQPRALEREQKGLRSVEQP